MNNPLLLLLPLVPFLVIELIFIIRLSKLPNNFGLEKTSYFNRCIIRRLIALITAILFWTSCIFALQIKTSKPRIVSEKITNSEVVFVLDASNSMLSPINNNNISKMLFQNGQKINSRLDYAKALSLQIASSLNGSMFSLIAFKGNAITLCPFTNNFEAFRDALSWVTPDITSEKGTSFVSAINEIIKIKKSHGISRTIILLTDGNDTGGNVLSYIEKLKDLGIRLAIVGFGDNKAYQVYNSDGIPIKDKAGILVKTAIDEKNLLSWATISGGKFFKASDSNIFSNLYTYCNEVKKGKYFDSIKHTGNPSILIICALVFLFLTFIFTEYYPLKTKE